ncbi:hypothetical protein [Halomonas sp. Mc5H-6]|uniref:hypothetical protein n=1 Tax=Halomonas sp. Mc5H-6 TaxID=2954500 RepID=UPI002096FB1B|nr:hypothetical protein [Halomonas sp. Mc5H-6]MCO7246026.1 hypothetical protein [Halomonas sp. Mc5H-6]
MGRKYREFLTELFAIDSSLKVVSDNVYEDWAPVSPPLTILFATIGVKFAEEYEERSLEINQKILRLVEEGVVSEDEELGTAVATGMVEAMVNNFLLDGIQWEKCKKQLGEQTLKHAEAWTGKV